MISNVLLETGTDIGPVSTASPPARDVRATSGRSPKISVVTISFNQVQFLERTIRSVVEQTYRNFEYIIVDPGSTDGSRDLIERYRDRFAHVIFERDEGAADGLNRGFARATGDIFFYLNSDDTITPDAFQCAVDGFNADPSADVLCGHSWIVDEHDRRLRRAWSDRYSRAAAAYGQCIVIQPSTYIRAEWFRRVGGFNKANRSSWDGELVFELGLAGATIRTMNAFISGYRLHTASITGSGSSFTQLEGVGKRLFRRMYGREPQASDNIWKTYYWLRRKFFNFPDTIERMRRGAIFMRDARRPIVRGRTGSLAVQLLALPLPWRVRRWILRKVLGFRIADGARIGLSIIGAREVQLGPDAAIGNLTYVKGLSRLILGERAILGRLNWVTGFPKENPSFFSHVTDRDPSLVIEDHAAITSRHLVDCTDRVTIAAFATFAGWGSQILTHSIDLHSSRQSCAPVRIGRYCFVGTRCVVLPGSDLGDYNVLAAGSVLGRTIAETHKVVSGAPAVPTRDIADQAAYFSRSAGFVR